jgi:hypothetical protein
MKIGSIKEESLEFNQALYPMSKKELDKVVKVCVDNNYPFAFPVLKKPIELGSAITDEKYIINYVILIYNENCDDIVNKVEFCGSD